MTEAQLPDPRADELRADLDRLRRRVDVACAAAGRSVADITLIAVTKTYPAGDVLRLAALGQTDFGENRVGELEEKSAALPAATWHFLGTLQSRQTRAVATRADAVHSVDRAQIAVRLGRTAADLGRSLDVFVQLSLDGDPHRGGVVADRLPALADLVAGTSGLRLAGVMAVPPIGADPRAAYGELAEIAVRVRREHPTATAISAGMSGDLEAAIGAGATHLRIGTALLGRREGRVG